MVKKQNLDVFQVNLCISSGNVFLVGTVKLKLTLFSSVSTEQGAVVPETEGRPKEKKKGENVFLNKPKQLSLLLDVCS